MDSEKKVREDEGISLPERIGSEDFEEPLRGWIRAAGKAEHVEGNPPSWVRDEAKWKKAKEIAQRNDAWKKYDEPWALVTYLYKHIGGRVADRTAGGEMRGWALLASAGIDSNVGDDPVWIQIAREGTFRGHPTGPFELRRKDLEEIVRNFRARPEYKKGENGYGCARVVPFDFHHASEQRPAELAVHGAPAQAWALDLEVRDGADGKAELWALTEYLEPARTYVREGRYRGVSVALWPDSLDPVTGERIGWYLSSIAFTNDPFIQGMLPLAAAARCCPDLLRRRIVAQIAMVEHDEELERYLAEMPEEEARRLAKYPFEECLKDQRKRGHSEESAKRICGWIYWNYGPGSKESERRNAGQAAAESASSGLGGKMMDGIVKFLADRFGLPVSEEAVQKRLLAELEEGVDAKTALQTLLDLLGSPDLEEAKEKIKQYQDAIRQLEAILPALREVGEQTAEAEEKEAESDVGAAMASMNAHPKLRGALVAQRTGGVGDLRKVAAEMTSLAGVRGFFEQLAKRLEARTEFRKQYLSDTAPASVAVTAGPLVTKPTDIFAPILRTLSARTHEPVVADTKVGEGKETSSLAQEVERCAGRNLTEKAMALVRSRPGGESLSFEQCHAEACEIVRQLRAGF